MNSPVQAPFEREIAGLIVEALHLEMPPEEIEPTQALFGDGLGLDSIDALEIALAVSSKYGFQLKSDDERNEEIFASLRSFWILFSAIVQSSGASDYLMTSCLPIVARGPHDVLFRKHAVIVTTGTSYTPSKRWPKSFPRAIMSSTSARIAITLW